MSRFVVGTAADTVVASWASISPEERDDIVARLIDRNVIRICDTGGYSIDLGDGLPTWRPNLGGVNRLLFGPAAS